MDITKNYLLFQNLLVYSQSISDVLILKKSSNKKKLFTCGIHVNLQSIITKTRKNKSVKCGKCNNQIINNINILQTILFENLLVYSKSISDLLFFTKGSNKKKLFTCGIHVNLQIINKKLLKLQRKCGKCNNQIINNINILQTILFNNLIIYNNSISNILYLSENSNLKKLFTCGIHINKQSIYSKNNGNKCGKCNNQIINNINILQTILFNDLIIYNKSISNCLKLSIGSKKYKLFICDRGHVSFQIIKNKTNHKNPVDCNKCNLSKLEEKCSYILSNLNIKFISQKTFDECKYKRTLKFDKYLPNYNIIIELDGQDHFQTVNRSGKMTNDELETRLKINKLKDNIKNEFAKTNNIRLLRISYSEINNMKTHIENFINSDKLFEFYGVEYK